MIDPPRRNRQNGRLDGSERVAAGLCSFGRPMPRLVP